MKRKKFSIIIIAMFLALFAVGLPAAAVGYNTVGSGNTVFIGEEGLDISGAVGNYTQLAWYTSGSDLSGAPSYLKSIGDSTDFYVAPADFNSRTGAWYLYDGTNHGIAFLVEVPSITVRVYDVSKTDPVDVTDKGVSRESKLDFRIETNLYLISQQRGAGDIDVKVVSPSGAVYTSLIKNDGTTVSIENINVNSALYFWANKVATNAWNLNAVSGTSKVYTSGEYKVSAKCDVNNLDVSSSSKTVTIMSEGVRLTTNMEKVTRGNGFAVTVSGQPKQNYYVFVKSVQTDPAPYIADNQKDVIKGSGGDYITESGKLLHNSVPSGSSQYYANVTTDSSGKVVIGFQTNQDTADKKYTIRVENKIDGQYKSDEVSVIVSEGKISVVTEGDAFFFGDVVDLTGINTETDTVYLFITGANLPSAGGQMKDPFTPVVNGDANTFGRADVSEDDSFTYKWDTGGISLDAGSYTIYAVTGARNRDNLKDVQYATTSVILRKPYLSASVSPDTLARGDKLIISGTTGTESTIGIKIWILGKNYVNIKQVSIDSDSTFEYKLDGSETENLAEGQYFIVVQHPMYNNEFDVFDYDKGDGKLYVAGYYPVASPPSIKFTLRGSGSLQGSDAANALIKQIDDPSVDDTYMTTDFLVESPYINVNAIPTTMVGDNVTVAGVTNLAVGDELLITILSSSFKPTDKNQAGGFSGSTKTVKVVTGSDGYNVFSTVFDTNSNYKIDEYVATVSKMDGDISGTAKFNLAESTPTPTPTPTPVPTTAQPTPEPTTAITTPPTPEPTPIVTEPPTTEPTPEPVETKKAPGFGALIAVVGLVGVGYLIISKNETEEEHGN